MADGDFKSQGTGTLPVSGPGVISTVTVTDASVAATDKIHLTLTSSTIDSKGGFTAFVSSVGAGSFVISCNREQLPTALTFNYHAIATV